MSRLVHCKSKPKFSYMQRRRIVYLNELVWLFHDASWCLNSPSNEHIQRLPDKDAELHQGNRIEIQLAFCPSKWRGVTRVRADI